MNNKNKDLFYKNFKKNIIKTIKNLNLKTKTLLLLSAIFFILSKLLSLFKINIPGLNQIPIIMILLGICLNILKKYEEEENSKKRILYIILGAIPLTLVSFFIFGFLISYPFILISLFM